MADLQKIVDDLSKLTVLEAADLAKKLKEKWSSSPASPVLFERRERTRTEPLQRGEGLFEFYNPSASPGYDEFRAVVNAWLAQMPADAANDLISRMRYGGDREFGASLAELSLHAFILGSGCKAIPHPEVPGTTNRPDYLVTDQAGTPLAYVEVTTVNPSHKQAAEKNRENPIYSAIDAAKIPAGTMLGYRLVRAGKNSPALKPLVAEVERWARDNAEAAKAKHVNKTFAAGEWLIELDLYTVDGNGDSGAHAIDVVDMGGGIVEPQEELCDALYEKTLKYGAIDIPYLIAVADGKDQIFGKNSVNRALTQTVFGDEIVHGGTGYVTHAKNGFWHGPEGPRNQHVSGVLLLPQMGLWKLREENWQPALAVNPWAERPLPDALRLMKRFEADNGRWVVREGKQFADIVGLPDPWPPSEPGK
jgi:hypothetical protein